MCMKQVMMVIRFAGLLCSVLSQGGLWVADLSPHMHDRAWSDGAQLYWCVEQNPLPFFCIDSCSSNFLCPLINPRP